MLKEPVIADQSFSTSVPRQTRHALGSKPLQLKHPSAAATTPVEGRTTSKAVQLLGCFLVFCAAALFYFSTATIRWAAQHVSLDPAFFVFVRFVSGFVLVNLILLVKRQSLRARRYDLLAGRAVANAIAVYCFYTAVSKTTLAEANILNMTYPVFVAVFSWIFLKRQRDTVMTIGALIAFVGIWLVLARGPLSLGWNHLWGLTSGVCAAWAIIFLNLSRRHHDTQTVLFYLFGLGAILTFAAFPSAIFWPSRDEAHYLALCSGFAIAGQYCITFGYRYVTAVEGGIISSSRILLAAILGPFIAADPALLLKGWFGAAVIMGVNILLAVRKARNGRTGKS
jgi:drug/metabolite transporter (DMT)-like permease